MVEERLRHLESEVQYLCSTTPSSDYIFEHSHHTPPGASVAIVSSTSTMAKDLQLVLRCEQARLGRYTSAA
jgi:hypothetical protein